MIVVLTTTPNIAEAESLAHKIVEAKLAACVQILPAMASVFIWNGVVRSDTENLLLIKTLAENFPELERFIITNHSYEVPEIVALNAEQVSSAYLGWVIENVAKEPKP